MAGGPRPGLATWPGDVTDRHPHICGLFHHASFPMPSTYICCYIPFFICLVPHSPFPIPPNMCWLWSGTRMEWSGMDRMEAGRQWNLFGGKNRHGMAALLSCHHVKETEACQTYGHWPGENSYHFPIHLGILPHWFIPHPFIAGGLFSHPFWLVLADATGTEPVTPARRLFDMPSFNLARRYSTPMFAWLFLPSVTFPNTVYHFPLLSPPSTRPW